MGPRLSIMHFAHLELIQSQLGYNEQTPRPNIAHSIKSLLPIFPVQASQYLNVEKQPALLLRNNINRSYYDQDQLPAGLNPQAYSAYLYPYRSDGARIVRPVESEPCVS